MECRVCGERQCDGGDQAAHDRRTLVRLVLEARAAAEANARTAHTLAGGFACDLKFDWEALP